MKEQANKYTLNNLASGSKGSACSGQTVAFVDEDDEDMLRMGESMHCLCWN